MFKWLGKLWRRDTAPDIHDYGRYVNKPVIQRALAMVMNMSQTDLVRLVGKSDVYLNNDKLDLTHLVLRMESGGYEIKIPAQNKIWRFFIA